MLGLFQAYDTQLFLTINHLPHNFLLDSLFGFVTLLGYFGAIWLLFGITLTLGNKKKFKNLLPTILLAEIIYLFFVEVFVKNLSTRLRPQFSVADTVLPYDFSRSFSFPSGHTTIAFAAAFILGRHHKKLKWFYYLLAALISFSRIYLGKHYPSDVVAGALIGLLIAFCSNKLVSKLALKPTKFQL